jgi:hypothetical protein
MDFEYSQLSDFDIILFYGENDLDLEIQSEILAGLIQGKRSLFYNRQDGCGISENVPNGLSSQISMRYQIAKWGAYRNSYVTDGSSGSPDRRALISQNSVSFDTNNKNDGNMDLNVLYVPMKNNLQVSNNVTIQLT